MVKMKQAYLKDSKKMFKNNFGRFVSIVLIIMLGTAFFIGMNSVSPAMKSTAEEYMKEKDVFDIALQSNLGYKNEDVDKFKENEHVKEVQGIHTCDVLAEFGEKDIAIRLASLKENSNMNKNDISEGRDIEKDDECLVSSRIIDMYGYKIGEKIKVYRKDDTNLDDYLNYKEFEIVGVTKTPMYLSKFYGNTSLLTGELNGYIMLKESAFKMEEYTAVYIKTDIDKNISRFSDEYKDKLDDIVPDIEKINENIAKEKYDNIHKESSDKISENEETIKKVEDYVDTVNNQIKQSQLQVNSGISDILYVVANYYKSNSLYQRVIEKKNAITNLYEQLNKYEEEQKKLEDVCTELKPKTINLKSELEELENNIDKNLYEIYSLDEESEFVELSKKTNSMYYDYNKKNEEYEEIDKSYQEKNTQLENTKKQVTEIKENINSSQTELYNLFSSLEDLTYGINNNELSIKYQTIKESREQIEKAKEELKNKNIEQKVAEAREKLNDKKDELNQFKYVTEETPLYKNSGFKSLKDDLEKIAIMGKIFPVMFFVVAALVTITTITRMIEEDRKNIGTLKALGYSKQTIISRYIKFALATAVMGVLLGTIIGTTLIVQILFVSYSSLYDLPNLSTRIDWKYTLIATIISLLSTVLVTLIITSKSLKENAASLMRPKATKEGKNILLEKIPFIWKRLDFLFKICFRNIFRYKRRLLMTLVGIAGCTALIYAGLGLQSAINGIGEKQFKNIRKLSMEVYLQKELSEEEIKEVEKYVQDQEHVKELTPVNQQTFTVEANDNTKDVFYIAMSGEDADKYIGLQERKSQDKLKLNDDGVIITEKLANILDVKVGEKIKIIDGDATASVKVTGISENYLYNYVYLTPGVYKRIHGKDIKYNEIFVNLTDDNLSNDDEVKLSDKLKENDKVASIILEKNLNNEFQTSLGSLMSIVILFIGCASLLSFTVLVNLNNINIEERKRELATIKLLGFYKKELESYVFRENIILTIFGTILGLGLGMGILGIIIQSAEVETIFLAKDINIVNLFISAIVTISFTLITNLLMKKKIKNINMIDSLKSVE